MVSFLFQKMTEDNIISTEQNTDPVIDDRCCCYDPKEDITIYNCTTDDSGNIFGYTEDGIKAKYSIDSHKWLYGREIGYANLVYMSERPIEDRVRIGKMGADKLNNNRADQKTLNEIAKEILQTDMSEDSISEVLGSAAVLLGDNKQAGAVMIVKMLQTALAGSFKAAEFVRDTAGFKPVNQNAVDISGNIMTDEDRSLIDKLNKRLTG